jgi:hypothetical protein
MHAKMHPKGNLQSSTSILDQIVNKGAWLFVYPKSDCGGNAKAVQFILLAWQAPVLIFLDWFPLVD